MTDLIDAPLDPPPADPAPEPVSDPRVLTPAESDAYAARLALVGFTFTVAGGDEAIGFDVTNGLVTYNYRYDATATTAVELMDRICAERGA